MRQAFQNLIVAAALMGAANVGFVLPAAEDPVDATPAQKAVARLGSFPGEVETITTAIARVSLSSGKVSYICSYTPLGKLAMYGDRKLRYDGQVSLSDLEAALRSRVLATQGAGREFSSGFTPLLRQWAQTTLPQTSEAFGSASLEVSAVQDEMKKGIGPSESQRTRVIVALDRILLNLGSGKGQLGSMAGILSKYLQQQRGARGSLSDWSKTATGQVQARAEKVRREMNQKRCQGDGPAQLDTIVRNANASIAAITANIGELEKRDGEADRALSIVLGTFVGYASRYEAVADRLKVVKEAPLGSTIQGLHLAIASRTWQDLVAAAKTSGL